MVVSEIKEKLEILDQLVLESSKDVVEDLSKLLMFSTVSGENSPEEKRHCANEMIRAFSFLQPIARQMGFEWRNYQNRVCVIEQPGGDEVIGLPLHLDVVPSGEGWHYPAFGGMVENGVLYGRGAQDNKGPLIEMLYALAAVKRLNLPFRRTVRLIIATQEETGQWTDIDLYLEKEPAPDFSIVADADFPIVNAEKGLVDLKIEIAWKDPIRSGSTLEFQSVTGGERPNIVPNRAEITWLLHEGQAAGVSRTLNENLSDFLQANPAADAFPIRIDTDPDTQQKQLHITFLGKGAHASRPEDGHNAAIDALRYFAEVPQLPRPLAAAARFLGESCANSFGEGLGIAAEHPVVGKTTVNLGMLHIDSLGATAWVNIRPTLGTTSEQILQAVSERVAQWAGSNNMVGAVSFHGRPHEPLYVDPESHGELIGALQEAYTRVTGRPASLIAKGGTTFAKAFPNAVSYGPVDRAEEKDLAHQADECVHITHMMRNVRIYASAIMLLAIDFKAITRSRAHGLGLGL